ncbi:hypothetical protein D5754_18575 [Salmonella enterica subsp. enterica serovar Saphra]|nr:hypothetical protein [Salmonella enterica subsp. enterica serovar Saphra]
MEESGRAAGAAALPRSRREPSFLAVHARDGTRGGKRDCQRTGNPFIKALQACQNRISPDKAGMTPRRG